MAALSLLLSTLLSAAPVPAQAPPAQGPVVQAATGILVGWVRGARDGHDGPLAGVRVEVVGPGTFWAEALTDGEGRWRIEGVPAGEGHMRYTGDGWRPLEGTFRLGPADQDFFRTRLEVDQPTVLTVEVAAGLFLHGGCGGWRWTPLSSALVGVPTPSARRRSLQ